MTDQSKPWTHRYPPPPQCPVHFAAWDGKSPMPQVFIPNGGAAWPTQDCPLQKPTQYCDVTYLEVKATYTGKAPTKQKVRPLDANRPRTKEPNNLTKRGPDFNYEAAQALTKTDFLIEVLGERASVFRPSPSPVVIEATCKHLLDKECPKGIHPFIRVEGAPSQTNWGKDHVKTEVVIPGKNRFAPGSMSLFGLFDIITDFVNQLHPADFVVYAESCNARQTPPSFGVLSATVRVYPADKFQLLFKYTEDPLVGSIDIPGFQQRVTAERAIEKKWADDEQARRASKIPPSYSADARADALGKALSSMPGLKSDDPRKQVNLTQKGLDDLSKGRLNKNAQMVITHYDGGDQKQEYKIPLGISSFQDTVAALMSALAMVPQIGAKISVKTEVMSGQYGIETYWLEQAEKQVDGRYLPVHFEIAIFAKITLFKVEFDGSFGILVGNTASDWCFELRGGVNLQAEASIEGSIVLPDFSNTKLKIGSKFRGGIYANVVFKAGVTLIDAHLTASLVMYADGAIGWNDHECRPGVEINVGILPLSIQASYETAFGKGEKRFLLSEGLNLKRSV